MLTVSTLKRLISWVASTECAVALFLVIAVVAVPGTFAESRAIYSSPFFLSLLGAFALNLLLCTLKRFKTLSKSVLILHGGVLLTISGCVLTSFGYVATVNVHEGIMTDQAYRWDLEKDAPLGFGLTVNKINRDFHPMPIKVGVLKGQNKEGLFVLKTGEYFDFKNYRIKVGALEYPSENLKLLIYEKERLVGSYNTLSGIKDLPADFPYSFKLVANQLPKLKRMWVDLVLTKDFQEVSNGISEINNPLKWSGLYFYTTQADYDPSGAPYAGIQIVRDPGRPVVFTGFAIMGLGAVLSYKRRFFRKSK